MELYKDGLGIGENTHSGGGDVRNSFNRVNFGRTQDNGHNERFLDGRMDECVIYNKSFSDQAAWQLYLEASVGNQYPFYVPAIDSINKIQALDPEKIVTITRYVVYKHDGISEIMAMKVVLWQE